MVNEIGNAFAVVYLAAAAGSGLMIALYTLPRLWKQKCRSGCEWEECGQEVCSQEKCDQGNHSRDECGWRDYYLLRLLFALILIPVAAAAAGNCWHVGLYYDSANGRRVKGDSFLPYIQQISWLEWIAAALFLVGVILLLKDIGKKVLFLH
ncbi:MAG: hypothetical protein IJ468_00850 [Lachnospiraceae bacterium]|nr:hypothetical protein [Lachnospiraceae bacterium]